MAPLRQHRKLKGRWPGTSGGSYGPDDTFMPSGEVGTLVDVDVLVDAEGREEGLKLKIQHEGREESRTIGIEDKSFLETLRNFLKEQVGRSLAEIGSMEADF